MLVHALGYWVLWRSTDTLLKERFRTAIIKITKKTHTNKKNTYSHNHKTHFKKMFDSH